MSVLRVCTQTRNRERGVPLHPTGFITLCTCARANLQICNAIAHASQAVTGGGNWRLRWCPHDPSLLLAACMYNGFAVLRMDGASPPASTTTTTSSSDGTEYDLGGLQLAVDGTYMDHGSIAYGADWWYGHVASHPSTASNSPGFQRHMAATCSFYDKLLKLWSWPRAAK